MTEMSDGFRARLRGAAANDQYEDREDSLGPCGCTDYHMADCSSGGAWLSQDSQDPLFLDEPDDDPRQYEDEEDVDENGDPYIDATDPERGILAFLVAKEKS
jgi:hypothetical protein